MIVIVTHYIVIGEVEPAVRAYHATVSGDEFSFTNDSGEPTCLPLSWLCTTPAAAVEHWRVVLQRKAKVHQLRANELFQASCQEPVLE